MTADRSSSAQDPVPSPMRGGRLALLLTLTVVTGCHRRSPPDAPRPSVLVIIADDLGFADLGCMGAADVATPNLDRLAREGVRLTNAYAAAPTCTPTRAAFFTGRYPPRSGLEGPIPPALTGPGLPVTETTLARLHKDAGYRTALFGKWHLGYRMVHGPEAHGFDEFFGVRGSGHDYYTHRDYVGALDLHQNGEPIEMEGYTTDLVTEFARRYLRQHATERFFVVASYTAAHWPFQPPGRPDDVRNPGNWFDGTREGYAAMIERMDEGVGMLQDELERQGVLDDTLIVFFNDNGGENAYFSDNGVLQGGKGSVHEGGIRVPCFLRWPARLPRGATVDAPSITMDLSATLLGLAGIEPPRPLDGIDLMPLIRGEPAPDRMLFWRIVRRDRRQWAAREGRFKYLRIEDHEMLFDVESDPGEATDLLAVHPERTARLRSALRAWDVEMDAIRTEFEVR